MTYFECACSFTDRYYYNDTDYIPRKLDGIYLNGEPDSLLTQVHVQCAFQKGINNFNIRNNLPTACKQRASS